MYVCIYVYIKVKKLTNTTASLRIENIFSPPTQVPSIKLFRFVVKDNNKIRKFFFFFVYFLAHTSSSFNNLCLTEEQKKTLSFSMRTANDSSKRYLKELRIFNNSKWQYSLILRLFSGLNFKLTIQVHS